MLIKYFLWRFVSRTIFYLFLITFVLASSNIFIRLPGVINVFILPQLFCVMLPLVILFSFPIAVALAVQIVVGNVVNQEEIIPLIFMKKAKNALFRSIIIFMLITIIFYAPLVFFWGPSSYDRGKRLLIGHTYEQIQYLEPKVFHFLWDGISFYFNDKEALPEKTLFNKILLMVTLKNNKRYFFSADKGFLIEKELSLENGSLIIINKNNNYTMRFAKTNIDLQQLLKLNSNNRTSEAKLKILPQLIENFSDDKCSQIEFYKRTAQLFWQIFLPFIALFFMLSSFGAQKNLMLWSIISSGFLFFVQYASLTLAQALQHISYLPFCIFFFPPIIILFYLFRRVVL